MTFNKVLLVEDDPIAVMLCTKVLQKCDFAQEINTAFNGQKAIEYYQRLFESVNQNEPIAYPRLVFLDLNMPVLGGWEFLDEFMQHYYPSCPETRVVILSSSIVPEDREKAAQYSIVVDFLSKPISTRDIQTLSQDIG